MKIELNLNPKDRFLVLTAFRHACAQSGSKSLFDAIDAMEKRTLEIEMADIAGTFIAFLQRHTAKPVSISSNLKYDLSLSTDWLSHKKGLARVCNETLDLIVKQNGGTHDHILPSHVSKKATVQNVVDVLSQKYHAA